MVGNKHHNAHSRQFAPKNSYWNVEMLFTSLARGRKWITISIIVLMAINDLHFNLGNAHPGVQRGS